MKALGYKHTRCPRRTKKDQDHIGSSSAFATLASRISKKNKEKS